MKTERVIAAYLSCTGTTRKITEHIAAAAAEKLSAEYAVFDFSLPKERETVFQCGEGDLVSFGTPVYAGRVPNLFLPYLREKLEGGGALAVPVVLFGNRNFDDALAELRDLLEKAGFHTIAAGAFVGEHSFSSVLGKGRPDAEDLEQAGRLAELSVSRARMFGEQGERVLSPVPVPGASPQEVYYTPRDRYGKSIDIRKVKPKTDEAKCRAASGCRICAEICPLGAIDPADPTKVPGVCMKCGACIKRCPVQAKYYDDPGYLYHKTELEELYARRADSVIY